MERKEITVTLDSLGYDSKPSGKSGEITNRLKVLAPKLLQIEMLAHKVAEQGYTFTPAIFKEKGKFSADNVSAIECFGIDIDCKGEHAGWKIEDTVQDLKQKQLDYAFIYKTFSYFGETTEVDGEMKGQSHRVIFLLKERITDPMMFNLVLNMLQYVFPKADKLCKNPNRMFFGGRNKPVFPGGSVENVRPVDLATLYYCFCEAMNEKDRGNKNRELEALGKKFGLNLVNGHLDIDVRDGMIYPNFQVESGQFKPKTNSRGNVQLDKIYDVQKLSCNYGVEELDINKLYNKCELFTTFVDGKEWLYYPDITRLLSNLYMIKGGVKLIVDTLKSYPKFYNSTKPLNHYLHGVEASVNTFSRTDYQPYGCKGSQSCDRCESCSLATEYSSMYQFLKEGQLNKPRFVGKQNWFVVMQDNGGDLPATERKIDLQHDTDLWQADLEAGIKMRKILDKVSNETYGTFVLQAPTGIGKTERLVNYNWSKFKGTKVAIAEPTHALKDEVYGRFVEAGNASISRKPEKIKLQDPLKQAELDRLLDLGLIAQARGVYYKELNEKKSTVRQYSQFLDEMENYKDGDVTLTTHADILFGDERRFHSIIADEDLLKSSLTNINTVQKSVLLEAIEGFDTVTFNEIRDFLKADNGALEIYGEYFDEESKFMKTVEQMVREGSRPKAVLEALTSNMLHVKPDGYVSFGKRLSFPNRPIVILSATADRQLFNRVFHDLHWDFVGNVVDGGKVIQVLDHQFSRRDFLGINGIGGNADKIIATMKFYMDKFGFNPQTPVLTFKKPEIVEILNYAGFNVVDDMYFGKTTGFDRLNGQDLVVLGVPHIPEWSVKMTASLLLGYEPCMEDIIVNDRKFNINGVEIRLPSFENDDLRSVQQYLIQSELQQAIGRARTARNKDTKVLLFSKFPVNNVDEFWFKDEKLQNTNAVEKSSLEIAWEKYMRCKLIEEAV